MKRGWRIGGVVAAVLILASVFVWRGAEGEAEGTVPWSTPRVDRDLEAVLADTLRVLVLEDPLTWEERPKAVSGLEFELLERFAKHLHVPLKAIVMDQQDSMFMALQEGRGDVIAAQWTPHREQRDWVAFSHPYRMVRPVVAVLRPDPVRSVNERDQVLDRPLDTVAISGWSPFAAREYRFLPHGPGPDHLRSVSGVTQEDLLMEVVLGHYPAAVITDARAAHETGRFPVLEFNGPVGPEQPLCFVLRKNAPHLRKSVDAWLKDKKETKARELLMKGYATTIPKPGPLRIRKHIPVEGDSVSPYDAEFQRYAAHSGWDWELLAAMAFKESRFDSTVVSNRGAQGIMQIMPRTAQRLGLDSTHVMGDHIRAAARYLNKLDTMWMRAIPDKGQRLRFMLASYNAGPGHIIDAQRLAEHLGLDPDRWEHNVERAVLLLAKPRYYMDPSMKNGYCKGSQVFHHVRDVIAMYEQLKARRGRRSKE
ncbi:MAG: transglycosylase SLT domain-containing protein [Flavobacteriales bacterium]|nr:transglycosylase SLT domain-containing protein [Flavobacteriales bacterium]